jgi:uncharacterized protein YndB with AHSA1/START domain
MKNIRLEYLLKTTQALLFNRLSTESGLAEWFADDVTIKGRRVTFVWGKTAQEAEILEIVPDELIRFRWLDLGYPAEFEFSIIEDELTGDISLLISDQVEDEDVEDARSLWNSQILKLRHAIGSPAILV